MTVQQLVAVIVALSVSLVVPFAIRPVLAKLHVIDVPNARSSHAQPVLRGGGLAPLVGVLAGIALALALRAQSGGGVQLLVVLLASIAVGLIGLLEDIRGVRIAVRAGLQLLIGVIATYTFVTVSNEATWWWVPVGAVAFAGYTNVANFMDGINGISSLHGAAAGAAFAIVGVLANAPWLVTAGLVFAASFVAFLPWNLRRRRLFLGDVGSYLLGGGIGVIAIAAAVSGVPIVATLGPLACYLADAGTTLVKRVVRGEAWYEAHRLHVYQRLTDSGLSHIVVALIVTAATLVTSAIGLLGFVNTFAASVVALCGIALIAALYLCLPRLTRARSSAAADAPRSDLPERIGTHTASRWAVLGASGFIGSALIAELRARSFDVVAIPAPRLRLSSSATEAATLEQLANYQDVIDSLAETLTGIDVVVNAAGVAAPDSDADDTLFGANSLLPLVVLRAAERSRTARVVHLSSAAVQGRRKRLDESAETSPFSPYSRSKALGEAALLRYVENIADEQSPEAVIVRATSVQGAGRTTTQQLRRVARSRFAFVAGPGDRPTVVSSLQGLTEFVLFVGAHTQSVPTIVLQPWEGLTTGAVLEIAGGRAPRRLPASFCRVLVAGGYVVGAAIPAVNGLVRRVELMWLGQDQDAAWARSVGLDRQFYVADVLTTVQEAPK